MYARILLCSDGGTTSEKALSEALKFSKDQSAELRVLHVLDVREPDMGEGQILADPSSVVRERKQAARDLLAGVSEKAQAAGAKVACELCEVTDQSISDAVLDEAARWGAELIVVGSHGRHGLSRLLLGSVSDAIVRNAKVPVLVVR